MGFCLVLVVCHSVVSFLWTRSIVGQIDRLADSMILLLLSCALVVSNFSATLFARIDAAAFLLLGFKGLCLTCVFTW
jgi:hypothetical protein